MFYAFAGVRFTPDATDSSNKHEENIRNINIHFF